MTILFSNSSPKIWSDIQAFFFFGEILLRDKFGVADLKYDNNSSFKILAQKYPNKAFWGKIPK